jgi:hypothetical protein
VKNLKADKNFNESSNFILDYSKYNLETMGNKKVLFSAIRGKKININKL